MRARIRITGVVQGVGFRPFVYNLALRHGLSGFCLNDSEGVIIEVEGPSVEDFVRELRSSPPPLSRIETFHIEEKTDGGGGGGEGVGGGFRIRESVSEAGKFVLISPDISVCPDCLKELLDPSDRRHLYPFINCTNCGPRYSIIRDIPYDREKTTMASFRMCPECEGEYKDPSNRRFHAQPNACAGCGPSVWITGRDGAAERAADAPREGLNFAAIKKARALLKEGAVIAVKGLGGFHLACDAGNEGAVKGLRDKKRRPLTRTGDGASNKPFALMAPDVSSVRTFAEVSEEEESALLERTRPIVLLERRPHGTLPASIAPNNRRYGVMLPYTPLHHLLFSPPGEVFTALVMTSGNLSEEPIVISNEEALSKLSGIADFFLLHDRPIYMRVDDSIVKKERGSTRSIRRARGFTPDPIDLGETAKEDILACGALLKNTLCLIKGRNAILSQHLGDLENSESMAFFEETLKNLKNTFRARPSIIARDMHPDYMSARFAEDYALGEGIPDEKSVAVQHHHAHIVSVMAERGLTGEVIGVAFDGTGYGTDGAVWGGEILLSTRKDFTRKAHLGYVGLPGSDAAVREPWRMAVSHIHNAYGPEAPEVIKGILRRIDVKKTGIVLKMIESGNNTPPTSSAGRLFDAVSSIIALRDVITFEGEAAIELEAIADMDSALKLRPFEFALKRDTPMVMDTAPLIREVVREVQRGTPAPVIAGRFHRTISEMILIAAEAVREETGTADVALSGGVFQNSLLTGLTADALQKAGFKVWMNEKVPANDGGVSLGQAVIAWERVRHLSVAPVKML